MTARSQDAPNGASIALDSPEFLADPCPTYERLRRDTPVFRTQLAYAGNVDVYLLSRYKDCVGLTTDQRFRRVVEGSEPFQIPKALQFMLTDSMIMMDDPEHMRLRKLVSRAFTPKAISRLTDRTEQITCERLDGFRAGRQTDPLLEAPSTTPGRPRLTLNRHILCSGAATPGDPYRQGVDVARNRTCLVLNPSRSRSTST